MVDDGRYNFYNIKNESRIRTSEKGGIANWLSNINRGRASNPGSQLH